MTTDHAEYLRRWRALRGARTGMPGRPQTAPCGTVSAYKRHLRRGEPVDELCRLEWNQWQRNYYAGHGKKSRD